jgi:pyruvate ferredoxin oxidoreductase alpha subunit
MSQRDCGWIQLFAEDNQQAVDLHVQAFRLAEELSVPVMVCMDGFVLTHAFERVELPLAERVDAFLPSYEPRQVLDPRDPMSIGAMVGPEAFTEVRYLAHQTHVRALDLIPRIGLEYDAVVGHAGAQLLTTYGDDGADTVVVALGSVLGTLKDTVDELAAEDRRFRVVGITSYRPFPSEALRAAVDGAARVVVLERSLGPGGTGAVTSDVLAALVGTSIDVRSVVAGLGGRPVLRSSLRQVLHRAKCSDLDELTFLDLDLAIVEQRKPETAVEAGR